MSGEPLSEILARRIANKGLSRVVEGARVCGVAQALYEGEFEPISFRHGCLKIRVSSDAKAHLIRLQQKKICARLNAALKAEMVSRLLFEIH